MQGESGVTNLDRRLAQIAQLLSNETSGFSFENSM